MSLQSCIDYTKLNVCKHYKTCSLKNPESHTCIYGPHDFCGYFKDLEGLRKHA